MGAAAVDSRRAWLVAGCAFVANVAVFGVLNSFGAILGEMQGEFGAGRGATSLMFALTLCAYFVLGAATGPISDRVGLRPLMLAGSALMATGLALTAIAPNIWVAYATYGLGVGGAAASVYVPALTAIGGWFERQRTAALGVAASGIAVGTLAVSPLSAALADAAGVRAMYAFYAVATLFVLLCCAGLAQDPPRAARRTSMSLRAAGAHLAQDPAFARLYLSSAVMSTVVFVPLVFLPSYASDAGASHLRASVLLGVLGGASIAGRLGVGVVARRVEVLTMYRGSLGAIGLALLLWLSADGHMPALWMFAVAYGMAYGCWVALLPAVSAQLFGLERLGVTLGVLFTSGAIGALVGVPAAGAAIDAGGYETAIGIAAAGAAASWLIVRPLGGQAVATIRRVRTAA